MSAERAASPLPIEELRRLDLTWEEPKGIRGFLRTTSHMTIGLRYIVTALAFFLVGGIEAVLMRLQLSQPGNHVLSPEMYDRIFTLHGTTMMFLFAVPVMEGIGLYVVPLMVGTRNVAFPKLNALGYWVYVIGGVFLYVWSFAAAAPDTGWFAYVPLSGPQYAAGKGVDTWAQMITFTELSALIVAVELIVTILKQRAPGMSLDKVPLFAWSYLVMSFMVVFAMPAVMLSSTFLILDREIGTHFFNPAEGGDALLWQHLFWFFGHPEVYIIFIPALGMVSAIVSAHSKRVVLGHTAMVLSLVSTGFLGFGLWVHHMFATGLPQLGSAFFTVSSMMIAIPSGVQIFCWISTLWLGRPRITVPLLFVLGFFFVFVLGGITGVMLGSVPLDQQVHDSFFVVAHLHYVLIGGALFPLLGGLVHWFPKATGRMFPRGAGIAGFALVFVGFNLTFFPMHLLGLHGMPRRIATYTADTGWGGLNLLASSGAVVLAAGLFTLLGGALAGARRGVLGGANPWNAESLEWATSSPPPAYSFAEVPVVSSDAPLWTDDTGHVAGMDVTRREVLVTRPLDAVPDHCEELPGPSIWPLLMSAAITFGFIGSIYTPLAIPVGLPLFAITMIGWWWPRHHSLDFPAEERA